MVTVGAYEAKTRLAGLLEQVERGETVLITKHGRLVARLVPASAETGSLDDVISELLAVRDGARLGADSVRDLIDEGRRG